jgi:hypothetical protein
MSEGSVRKRTRVNWSDPDFSIRAASVDDLVRVQHDNEENSRDARWTSEDALLGQVRAGGTAIVCPLFRNGGRPDVPESYKCWLAYPLASNKQLRVISPIDIGKDIFSTLPEVREPQDLKRVVLLLLDSIAEGARFEVTR